MKNNDNSRTNALAKIDSIYAVDGFDPSILTETYDYTDSSTGEVGKTNVLPVRVRIAWFRLVYKQGKIAVTVNNDGDGRFVAEAKVYTKYDDQPENYLANAVVSRCKQEDMLNISPREWAQTAAIGKALCNAGFRLSSEIFCDELDPGLRKPDNDDGEDGAATLSAVETSAPESAEEPEKRERRKRKTEEPESKPLQTVTEEEKPEMSADEITPEMLENALNTVWKSSPGSKTAIFNGKTMREMLQSEDGQKILKWAAGKDSLGEFHRAAKIISLKAQA